MISKRTRGPRPEANGRVNRFERVLVTVMANRFSPGWTWGVRSSRYGGHYVEPAYIEIMLGREKVANTYLGNGIAIPHGFLTTGISYGTRGSPEEGLGEGMDQLVALVHHAYLLWDAGVLTLPLPGERLLHAVDPRVAGRRDDVEDLGVLGGHEHRRDHRQRHPGQLHH